MWRLSAVLSAARLFLLLGCGMAYLAGLGWLAAGPLLHGSLDRPKRELPLLQALPLVLLSGLIANYGLILFVHSLRRSLLIGGVLAAVGLAYFGLHLSRRPRPGRSPSAWVGPWSGAAALGLIFLVTILGEPLRDWDARSIWFFHAKMMYSAGGIGLSSGWQHPSVLFSHADYPKLVSALAAQLAYTAGVWNEYLPKTALFFVLAPASLWLFTFSRRTFSFFILLLLIPFSFHRWLWNGYMDGLLALYFSVALLLFGRYLRAARRTDLIASIGCLIFLVYLKNEGIMAALIGLNVLFVASFFMKKPAPAQKNWAAIFHGYLTALAALVPLFLWTYFKYQWRLTSDLGLGSIQSFAAAAQRLQDGSVLLIFRHTFSQLEGALLLVGLLFFASIAWKKGIVKESIPAFLAAGLYLLGLIGVYLMTPNDLTWQLQTTGERTMLVVNGAIFAGSYFILDALEAARPASPPEGG
jgi:hypothetical protein